MLQFQSPVKFIKSGVRCVPNHSKPDSPHEFPEVIVYIPDYGRVSIPLMGKPKLPADGTLVQVALSIGQDKYFNLRAIWDEGTQFKVVS